MTSHQQPWDSILETIGHTPLVRIQASNDQFPVYAKLEYFNPGGSVKDRIGKYILKQLLESGDLKPGGTVIEPTAGNTGIGMALVANNLGLKTIFVVPDKFSREKQKLMSALGAKLVFTSSKKGMDYAVQKAKELASEKENAVVPQQFSNPLNAEAHYKTTGPEIYQTLDGKVGAIAIGCGTTGTLMGTARYLSEKIPEIYILAVEPEGSVFGNFIDQDLTKEKYNIEGIGTHDRRINKLFNPDLVDDVMQISDQEAQQELKRLALEEGQLVATSSGAAGTAALKLADKIKKGEISVPYDNVVTVFSDSGERYLSKGIYDSYEEWIKNDS